MARDLYQEVTDSIIATIEAGAGKWQMPWACQSGGLPTNAVTKASYNGVNILQLWSVAASKGYPTGIWATYKQWQSIGAQVNAGEKGAMVVFAGTGTAKPEDGETSGRAFHFLKCSSVFNAAQVAGFDTLAPVRPALAVRIANADAFVAATGADVRYGNSRAFYSPSQDFIAMPGFDAFIDTDTASATENAYGILMHELTHWTSAKSRLDRELGKRFGDDKYAAEELVAELGAAFLCAELNITPSPRPDHAQYLASWLKVLKSDKKAIFTAASAATKAAQYLRTLQPVELEEAA